MNFYVVSDKKIIKVEQGQLDLIMDSQVPDVSPLIITRAIRTVESAKSEPLGFPGPQYQVDKVGRQQRKPTSN